MIKNENEMGYHSNESNSDVSIIELQIDGKLQDQSFDSNRKDYKNDHVRFKSQLADMNLSEIKMQSINFPDFSDRKLYSNASLALVNLLNQFVLSSHRNTEEKRRKNEQQKKNFNQLKNEVKKKNDKPSPLQFIEPEKDNIPSRKDLNDGNKLKEGKHFTHMKKLSAYVKRYQPSSSSIKLAQQKMEINKIKSQTLFKTPKNKIKEVGKQKELKKSKKDEVITYPSKKGLSDKNLTKKGKETNGDRNNVKRKHIGEKKDNMKNNDIGKNLNIDIEREIKAICEKDQDNPIQEKFFEMILDESDKDLEEIYLQAKKEYLTFMDEVNSEKFLKIQEVHVTYEPELKKLAELSEKTNPKSISTLIYTAVLNDKLQEIIKIDKEFEMQKQEALYIYKNKFFAEKEFILHKKKESVGYLTEDLKTQRKEALALKSNLTDVNKNNIISAKTVESNSTICTTENNNICVTSTKANIISM